MENDKLTPEQILETCGGYSGFVASLFSRTGSLAQDFCHAALGVATEVYEFRRAKTSVNAIEELGDISFYVEALEMVVSEIRLAQGGVQEVLDTPPKGLPQGLVEWGLEELLDIAKRYVGYGKVPPLSTAIDLARGLLFEARAAASNPDQAIVQKVNVVKLQERFKERKFSAVAAIGRDVGAELKVMENALRS